MLQDLCKSSMRNAGPADAETNNFLCCFPNQNVSILTKADRGSLFLVQDVPGSDSRCLVSTLFDVCSQSTLKEIEKKEEIHIPWGSGIVGYVAQKGETVNIPDAYKVSSSLVAVSAS